MQNHRSDISIVIDYLLIIFLDECNQRFFFAFQIGAMGVASLLQHSLR